MSNTPYPKATPALDHFLTVCKETQVAGEFLDWLRENGYVVAVQYEGGGGGIFGLKPSTHSNERLLAAWKGVDLGACERERQELLASTVVAAAREP